MTFRKGEPPPNKGRRFPGEPLTQAEVLALMAQCSRTAPTGIRDHALIVVLWRAGLRISEALELRPADVDMSGGTIRVLHGKGDRARTVGVDDAALSALQLWLARRRALGLARAGVPLFCTLRGGPVSDGAVRGMLRRRSARAGIEKRVHPHGLRHTHAAELAAEGVPVNMIQHDLGHAWLATTDTYLRHIAPADVIAAGRSRSWGTAAAAASREAIAEPGRTKLPPLPPA